MISTENSLSISAAANSLPGRPNVSTVWRWISRGVRGVKLQTFCVGGRRYVTKESLENFLAQTTAAANGQPAPTSTPRQRQKAIEAAEQELARAGI